jgi:methionyl-tRNA formyltransferase
LIPPYVLNAVPGGVLGVHYSLLPRYRGSAPLVWAILNGERETGFSVFSLTPGMDDGPLWAQGSIVIQPTDYVSDLLRKLEVEAIDAVRNILPGALTGSLMPKPQALIGASYVRRRTPADGLIDWTRSAQRLFDFVRAQSRPYPGAFTFAGKARLFIWRARVGEQSLEAALPGSIVANREGIVSVVAGDGILLHLDDVSWEGEARPVELTPPLRLGS